MDVRITPSALSGKVAAPPSKSYAHRIAIASFLSGEETRVAGLGNSKDVLTTLKALGALGSEYARRGDEVFFTKRKCERTADVYCGESGSTLRFLLPIVAALGINATFFGERGLIKRPVNGLIEALNANGAAIDGLTVRGKIKSGRYVIDGSVSSQYISGLMFALPLLDGDSEIVIKNGSVSSAYLDITIDVLNKFGVKIEKTDFGYFVAGGQKYLSPKSIEVEGDYSGAAFTLAAGALGGNVEVTGLYPFSKQGDSTICEILKHFGAVVERTDSGIKVKGGDLKGISVDVDAVPDLAQVVAVVAANAKGVSILKNVSRLKIKESDRLEAIIRMLSTAKVESFLRGDNLYIMGENRPIGGLFYGADDHRTAMSEVLLACYAATPSKVVGVESTEKSYPAFIDDIMALGGKIDVLI